MKVDGEDTGVGSLLAVLFRFAAAVLVVSASLALIATVLV